MVCWIRDENLMWKHRWGGWGGVEIGSSDTIRMARRRDDGLLEVLVGSHRSMIEGCPDGRIKTKNVHLSMIGFSTYMVREADI